MIITRPPEALITILITITIGACLVVRTGCIYQSQSRNNGSAVSRYELKFQNELDNSSTIKQEFQQQIFKCQVRLAPVGASSAASVPPKPRFKSNSRLLYEYNSSTQQFTMNKPSEVNLTIDWFKGDQLIQGGQLFEGEPVAVINVELKVSGNGTTKNNNDKTTTTSSTTTTTALKSKMKRIEIKNTLNGNQMKLTSRLRIVQLKQSDSGQYRCIAKVSFQMLTNVIENTTTTSNQFHQAQTNADSPSQTTLSLSSSNNNNNNNSSTLTLNSQWIAQFEQTLQSNEANLMVTNATTTTTTDEQEVREQGVVGGGIVGGGVFGGGSANQKDFGRQNNGATKLNQRKQQQQQQRQNNPATTLWNGFGKLFGPYQQTNDTQHATTTRLQTTMNGDHLEGGNHQITMATDIGPLGFSGSTGTRPIELIGSDNNNESSWLGSGRSSFDGKLQHKSQFEDDEDLFKMEQEKLEFINNQQQKQRRLQNAKTAPSTNDDDEDEQLQQLLSPQRAKGANKQLDQNRHQITVQANDMFISGDDLGASIASANEDDLDNNNESSSSSSSSSSVVSSNSQNSRNDQYIGSDMVSMESAGLPYNSVGGSNGGTTNFYGGNTKSGGSLQDPSSVLTMDHYFSNSLDSTRMRLVKLVHRIAPELSCYTGSGEHYRGNVSVSADKRPCMSWLLIQSAHAAGNGANIGTVAAAIKATDEHNHCRNPNKDPHGPWCYVQYSEILDSPMKTTRAHYEASLNPISGLTWKDKNDNNNTGNTGHYMNEIILRGIKYVPSSCSISPCSEYLWLYIVAPPFGLLILLSCLITILVRSIKKSHYQAMFSVKKRNLPKFNRLLSMKSKFVGRKFGASGRKKCGANYLDEDIFEIVDDLDWSDGQTQSLSPKSTTESLKLDSSFSSASTSNDLESRLSGCKSTNLIACGDRTIDRTADLLDGDVSCNKSVTQVGPMFATLRCHIRGSNKSIGNNSRQQLFNQKPKGLTRELSDLTSTGSNGRSSHSITTTTNTTDHWVTEQLNTSSSSSACKRTNQTQQTVALANGSHLISCSTTSNSIATDNSSLELANVVDEKYIKGTDLPLLDASNLTLAKEKQPIFEGKFSQVLLAYIEDGKETFTMCGGDVALSSSQPHQVAICSLKSNAAIDPSIMKPSNLKLRNLNHLNLLKLIGYAQVNVEIGLTSTNQQAQQQNKPLSPVHSLIYDMAQLVDLSDWLKQQNKDIMTTNEPGSDLRIRRNLTCFAKQLALAIDYLHNQGIIYRDLACRNCFLDPTKMLVKLASFNIELVIDSPTMVDDNGESTTSSTMIKAQNLRSMIRPKYLLDYYIIDSRPADCQLLPLSWIPLESILFNKFNKHTDVWSFGCLLYELFSLGKVAYFGYSSKQIIDAVRSNLMPPQPLLCPNGVYKLMCKCLSDIPTIRPNVKQIYEQLNLFSGQCSSFLDHHLCSLATTMYDDQFNQQSNGADHLVELKSAQTRSIMAPGDHQANKNTNSITKTKSYANIRNFSPMVNNRSQQLTLAEYDNLMPIIQHETRPETGKIPLSKSINLAGASTSRPIGGFGFAQGLINTNSNHYDEPVVDGVRKIERE